MLFLIHRALVRDRKKKKKPRNRNRGNNAQQQAALGAAGTGKNGASNGSNTLTGVSGSIPWYKYTPELVWGKICKEAKDYFAFDLEGCTGIDDVVEKFGVQKISFLRRFCIVMGIQVG